MQAAAAAAAAQAVQDGLLHLVQVQSHRLAPRMLLFDWPLKAVEGDDAMLQQLLPGFLDAPGRYQQLVMLKLCIGSKQHFISKPQHAAQR